MGMQALRQLEALEQQRPAAASGSLRVTVVGAGYAGIELATTLAERIGSRGFVQIIHGGALPPGTPTQAPHGRWRSHARLMHAVQPADSVHWPRLVLLAQAQDSSQLGLSTRVLSKHLVSEGGLGLSFLVQSAISDSCSGKTTMVFSQQRMKELMGELHWACVVRHGRWQSMSGGADWTHGHAGSDIMEPSSAGQREAARRTLMDSNVSITTNALVSTPVTCSHLITIVDNFDF